MATEEDITRFTREVRAEVQRQSCFAQISTEVMVLPGVGTEIGDMLAHNFFRVGLQAKIPMQEILAWSVPQDWWQAFKQRWFPEWAKKRWPVGVNRLKVEQIFDVAVPSAQSYLRLVVNENVSRKMPRGAGYGYCACCNMPVPVFYTKGGPRLNPPIAE